MHGFRSAFRDWAGERGVAREVAEMSLGHAFGNTTERAYHRGDLLGRRAEVSEAFGRFVEGAD